jgi:carbonic anhydrase/acetyltransferase-like protein (isoleucine patch superfamily)
LNFYLLNLKELKMPGLRNTRRNLSLNPSFESLETITLMATGLPITPADLPPGYYSLGNRRSPVVPSGADPTTATFIDPTTNIDHPRRVGVGNETYIAPFVNIATGRNKVLIGSGSDLQDNVTIDARRGDVFIGDNDVLAHGATVIGPSKLGGDGTNPTFVSFNSIIDRATLQPGSYVSPMARVGQGVVIRTGIKVLPGVYVKNQAEADDPALGKVVQMTQADIDFITGVLYVNQNLAEGYSKLYYQNPRMVLGISENPSEEFNPGNTLPVTNGTAKPYPAFRNRIIGKSILANSIIALEKVLGFRNSIRADEGYPFQIGRIRRFSNRVTFHALEHTSISVGQKLKLGYHVLIHGGPDVPNPDESEKTVIGDNVSVGDLSVVFRSIIGNNVKIGKKVLIDGSNIPDGAVIPDGTVMIKNVITRKVQW